MHLPNVPQTHTHTHTHTHTQWQTHDCKMSRAEANLRRLYVSADPALIQQTKLSLLNAQQKSSLAVIMQPPRPAAPQSTVLPSPLTSLTSLLSALYHTRLVRVYYQKTDAFSLSQLISSRPSRSQRSPTLDAEIHVISKGSMCKNWPPVWIQIKQEEAQRSR